MQLSNLSAPSTIFTCAPPIPVMPTSMMMINANSVCTITPAHVNLNTISHLTPCPDIKFFDYKSKLNEIDNACKWMMTWFGPAGMVNDTCHSTAPTRPQKHNNPLPNLGQYPPSCKCGWVLLNSCQPRNHPHSSPTRGQFLQHLYLLVNQYLEKNSPQNHPHNHTSQYCK